MKAIPGQIIAARMKQVGGNPFIDGLTGKIFSYRIIPVPEKKRGFFTRFNPFKKKKYKTQTAQVPETFTVTPMETAYPAENSHTDAHAYAFDRVNAKDYVNAAHWFEKATTVKKGGTPGNVWEHANLVSASYAWLLAGDVNKSKQTYARSKDLVVKATESERSRYLGVILGFNDAETLSDNLRTIVPKS